MTSIRACLLTASLAAAGVAQAQTAPPSTPAPATKAEDSSLTWKGITLYGIVDIGIQTDTHSAPFSDYFPPGSASLVQKNDYDSPTGITPSNLSQSRIGISGNEPIGGDWAAVFRLETFFNPQSGNISDALKSVALNNGKTCTTAANCAVSAQAVGVDSSVAGQYFSGAAYAGFSSPTYGTLTIGRNTTPLVATRRTGASISRSSSPPSTTGCTSAPCISSAARTAASIPATSSRSAASTRASRSTATTSRSTTRSRSAR